MTKITVVGGTVADILVQLPKRFLQRKITNEALVLPFGSKIESEDYILSPGGSGANVAVGLKKLGMETSCITGLSKDELGSYLESKLISSGVHFDFSRYDSSTSLSIVMRVGPDRTIITTHHDAYAYLKRSLPDNGWLHMGPLPENQPEFFQKFLAHVIKTDQKYSLNPSMSAIDERERYFLSVLKSATILFLNYEEGVRLARLSGKPEAKDVVTTLLRLGPAVVCVTCGSKGAYVGGDDGILFARALTNDDPDEMDATGAGDAFTSGFLVAYSGTELDGVERLELSLRYGIVNSAAVVASPGAQSGLLGQSQIADDLAAVIVKAA